MPHEVINAPLSDANDPYERWHPDVSSDVRHVERLLSASFGASEAVTIPCLYLFQAQGNDVVDGLPVPLSATGVDSVFSELRDYLDAVVRSLQNVKEQYKNNAHEIFVLAAQEVSRVQTQKRLYRWNSKIAPIMTVAKLFAALKGG